MFHCPYCGTKVKEGENFCINCGKQLPTDMEERFSIKKEFNQLWLLPIAVAIFSVLAIGFYYLILETQEGKAKELYEKGEREAMNTNYEQAKSFFEEALHHKKNFNQAEISFNFMDIAIQVESTLEEASDLSKENNYQEAVTLINESEKKLQNFKGPVVKNVITMISEKRNQVKIEQLNSNLNKDPSIDELKILLWEAEDIKNEEAEQITSEIRDQIIDYTFTKASEQMMISHFNDAAAIVQDGMKYAPDSEKLKSLQTTIDKEQTAFETAQQKRMEQAINMANEEKQINKDDAIKLLSVKRESDHQGNLVVKGKVKSVATIPINSILIKYSLLSEKNEEILNNEVYVYPDKLLPSEEGKFEFTHFDINKPAEGFTIQVNNITWYTD
ncbi:zinc ribbon domain-containing protein [Virgibacillus halodenitrificans]|uniref:zinc ribbon domain-containing protein n=1 Tax=Virgibacillus halodenitrificans TaxID=1482 RepID=UPI000760F649